MPKDISASDFHCPKCNKPQEDDFGTMFRCYGMQRFILPYFACGNCCVYSYDKRLIRQLISRYRKHSRLAWISYNQMYRELMRALERRMKDYKQAGWHFRSFKRN